MTRPALRWGLLGLVVVLVTALAAWFFFDAARQQAQEQVPTAATARDRALPLGAVLDAPHIVFRSTAPGPTYGRLAAVPLADPAGDRSVSSLACDRVYANALGGICLSAQRGAVTRYRADLLTKGLQEQRRLTANGIPSRARLSPDGTWAATTTFVSGHGYTSINFSTETSIVGRDNGIAYQNLEKKFTTTIDGRRVTAADLNVWGVTFPRGPRPTTFYATVATGGITYLARGDLTARTLTALRQDVECPSLSPDGTRIVYKKRAGSRIVWRYHVLDLRTMADHPLVETRSVDDQAEWLDDQRVLYGVPRGDSGETDVWVAGVRADAPAPRIFMRDAWSPAVVRGPV